MEVLAWILGVAVGLFVIGFALAGVAALFIFTGAPEDIHDVDIKGTIDRKKNVDAKK
jgi:hypothetical protein